MKITLNAGARYQLNYEGDVANGFYIASITGVANAEVNVIYNGINDTFGAKQGKRNLKENLGIVYIENKNSQAVVVDWRANFSDGDFVDNGTKITGQVSTSDTDAHTKLDGIKTETTAVKSAVQSVNAKLDGKYNGGVVPVGANSYSNSRAGNVGSSQYTTIFNSGSNGAIIRNVIMFADFSGHDCHLLIGTAKFGKLAYNDSQRIGDKLILQNLEIAPRVNVKVLHEWGYITMDYDIIR